MRISVSEAAFERLLVQASWNASHAEPLPADIRASMLPLHAQAAGSVAVSAAADQLAELWHEALAQLASDAGHIVDALRAVDRRYVDTEMTNASALRRADR